MSKTLAKQENKSSKAISNQEHADAEKTSIAFENNRPETLAMRKMQSMANAGSDGQDDAINTGSEGNSGLPSQLKLGVEKLSGQSMDDVSVHMNSDKPAQLNALAYAQGSEIHVAPGQEKHLPHEAWHVAQQKQGRVKPTTQLMGKVQINDDAGLEREADVMGAKAMSVSLTEDSSKENFDKIGVSQRAIQRVEASPATEEKTTKSFEASVEADLLVLRGNTSFWGWLTNSKFTVLKEKIDKYAESSSIEEKQILISEILTQAKLYLTEHKDKDNENDRLRRESIEKIVHGIERFENDSKAAAEKLSIAGTDDKVGLGAKMKKALFGEDTPFVQAVNAFTEYQNQTSSLETASAEEGMNFLKGVFEYAELVETKVDEWKKVHAKDDLSTGNLKDKGEIIHQMIKKIGVINVSLYFKYGNVFQFSGDKVLIDPLRKEFSVASIKAKLLGEVPGPLQELEAEVINLTYKSKAFDFSEINVTKPPTEFSPFPGIKLTTPPSVNLKKSGTDYSLTIGESGIEVQAGNLFKGEAKASGEFSFSSANPDKVRLVKQIDISTISVTILDGLPTPFKDLTAKAEGVSIKAEGDGYDYDFLKITLTAAPETFNPLEGFSFTTPKSIAVSKIDKGKYCIEVSNTQATINAGNWFNASATASGVFNYNSGETQSKMQSEIKIPTAEATIGASAPGFLMGMKGEVEDMVIRSGFKTEDEPVKSIDWKLIKVTAPPKTAAPFDGALKITAPNKAEIEGPTKKYKTLFSGADATAKFKDYFNANGKADFYIDNEGNKGIETASLKLNANSPKIPGEVPGIWPLSFTMSALFPPTPINVNLELALDGGAQAALDGSIDFKKDQPITFSIAGGMSGNVSLSIKVGAGAGHHWLVYAGVFAKASADAKAIGSGEFSGLFSESNGTYDLSKAELNYSLNASLTAQISAGAEAKALGFFNKTLYEVKSKKWNIGATERKGSYNLIDKTESKSDGTGMLAGKFDKNVEIPAIENKEVDQITADKGEFTAIIILLETITNFVLEAAKDGKATTAAKKPTAESAPDEDGFVVLEQEDSKNAAITDAISKDILSLSYKVKDQKARLNKLMPFIKIFRDTRVAEISNALKLADEIEGAQLPMILVEVYKKDPVALESVINLSKSLKEIQRIISKYSK